MSNKYIHNNVNKHIRPKSLYKYQILIKYFPKQNTFSKYILEKFTDPEKNKKN